MSFIKGIERFRFPDQTSFTGLDITVNIFIYIIPSVNSEFL